jgi:hypothetical protein
VRELRIPLAVTIIVVVCLACAVTPGTAADDSKVKSASRRVEGGAKMIGNGKVGSGVEETAKGVGSTVVEGAKYTGDKFKESGRAAGAPAKSAWGHLKEGEFKASADAFGTSVSRFFTGLFSGDRPAPRASQR